MSSLTLKTLQDLFNKYPPLPIVKASGLVPRGQPFQYDHIDPLTKKKTQYIFVSKEDKVGIS